MVNSEWPKSAKDKSRSNSGFFSPAQKPEINTGIRLIRYFIICSRGPGLDNDDFDNAILISYEWHSVCGGTIIRGAVYTV